MFFILFFLIAAAAAFLTFKQLSGRPNFDARNPLSYVAVAGVFAGVLIILNIQPFRVERVDAGNVGIKVHLLGEQRGVGQYEYKTGYVFYNKWTSNIVQIEITQQQAHFDNQKVTTYGGFVADIRPSFNYAVKAGNAGDMYVNLRKPLKQIEKEWLNTAIATTINDVSNKWKIDSIFTRRQEFEANIQMEINKKVGKWFDVSQLRTNMIPPPALVNAINAKTQATQEVQVAEQRKKVAIAEGITAVARARADSSVLVTRAAAEAKSNQLRQASITDNLLKQQAIEAWKSGGALVPQYVSGDTKGMIWSMPMQTK